MKRLWLLLFVVLMGGLGYVAAQQLPPGQIAPRPAEGREPEFPPPNIREYHPRLTLVVPEHLVKRARFPVVDVHGHPPFNLAGPDTINVVGDSMSPLNLQVMVNANSTSSESLKPWFDAIKASRYKDRMVMFTGLDLRNVGPGSGQKIAAQLEADVRAGALGVGEIMKSFGLTIKKADGTRLKLDDPELDPVWEKAADLNIPVFIHVADPSEFFQPLDYKNERWLELALYRDRRYQDRSRFPSFEDLMGERDRLFARHPRTTWILAHFGWHANDLARVGRMFDQYPKLYSELGAVLYDIGRQPRTAHDFFMKYQDRILFGKDSYQPDEYPYYWRVFETNDEYFDYYRDYHAFWKLYGIGLPDPVLKKVYYQNALKIVPGIPKAGFPANERVAAYLITGGGDFIGSHLAEALVQRGERVRVLDSFVTGHRHNLAHLKGIEIVEGDLADLDACRRAVIGVDYVLHQAAIPSVPRSVEDPLTSHRANIDGSLHILLASRDAGVKRLVYAGSSSAYGDQPTLPKDEDMPTRPLSPYALQKLVAEQYCQMFTRLYAFETVTIRYFNVFGPRQDPGSPYSGVISLFATALLAGRQPVIYGDGEQTRDFTYIANVVDGVLRACKAPGAAGAVINVATGGRISLNELLRVMNQIIGSDIQAVYRDARAGDVKHSQADISRARALLGYEPHVSLEDGLRSTLDWCRSESARLSSKPHQS